MKDSSVYSIITDRIVSLLEQGTIPWQKPWSGGQQAPQNLISRKPYRGVNVFLLNSMQYQSNFWLTFRQTQELGGFVKRGERGCPVVFWRWIDVENKETGNKEKIPFLRYYTVFNLAQVEGVAAPTVTVPVREFTPIQAAQKIVDGMPNRPEIKHGMARAFYSPALDFIGLPAADQFKTTEDYFSTAFHELTHSTGHASRLNRKGVNGSDGEWSSFGSNPYAKEELVAELGAAFLCTEAGITERTIDNSAAYISSWIQRLKNDSKLIVQASAQAQHAAEFILNRRAAEASELQPLAMAA